MWWLRFHSISLNVLSSVSKSVSLRPPRAAQRFLPACEGPNMRRVKTPGHGLVLTISALCVRLLWVFLRPWVAGDSGEYVTIARNIRFHHVFSLTADAWGPFLPTAFRPPLYPALIALLWVDGLPPVTLILVLQALMGAATVTLVYLSANDRFDRKVALLAACFMIIAPMTGYFTATILTEVLFTFLFMLAVFLVGPRAGDAVGRGLRTCGLDAPNDASVSNHDSGHLAFACL